MLAEILTIGDELCRGEIINTNASWFAEQLWELDVAPAWMTSCRDVDTDIRAAVEIAVKRAQIIVVSGGLGATEDDRTVDIMSALGRVGASVDPEASERWHERYRQVGRRVNAKTDRQLRVPNGSRVHRNPVGAAPGFEINFEGVPIICMPGVPREVHAIWNGSVKPRIVELRNGSSANDGGRVHLVRKTFRVFGRGESDISVLLDGLVGDQASTGSSFGESIHYRVKFPEILIKLVVRGTDEAAAREHLGILEVGLRERLGWLVYGVDDESLASVVGGELLARGRTLAVAESCTGGGLGAELTAVSGASAYFLGGVISYSNEVKQTLLGVASETIKAHGAVSEECAIEMARGARRCTGADIAVAITGIAGPGGGTVEKPVGTVWLAIDSDGGSESAHMVWPGERERIRRIASFRAMAMIRRLLSAVELSKKADDNPAESE